MPFTHAVYPCRLPMPFTHIVYPCHEPALVLLTTTGRTVTLVVMVIILDLDDVLANLRESLYQVMRDATGIDLHWQQWRHYDLCKHFNIAKQPLEDILMRTQALEGCQPEPDAIAMTAKLRQLGYKLHIITARGWHPTAEQLTSDWLQRHGVHYDALDVVPLGGNKLDVLPPADEIRFAVDDHPNNIRRYEDNAIPTLMVEMPWNAEYRGQTQRINSLNAVIAHAEKLLQ